MTDKVQLIKAKVEKRIQECKDMKIDSSYYDGLVFAFEEVIELIDSLPEEPVSEDLEEAAVKAFKQIVDSDKNNFLEIFKACAKWQKEQIAKKVVKQYADKGEKNYQDSVFESVGAAYPQDVYWDGFRDCANGIIRELKDN